MAGSASKVIRAGAQIEQPLADCVHLLLSRMRLRHHELQAARLGSNPGDQAFDIGLLALAERRGGDRLGVKTLERFHAGQQA